MFVDAPLGHTAGPPNDPEMQRQILTEALVGGVEMTEPGVIRLPYRWHNDGWRSDALGWSRKRESAGGAKSLAGDTRQDRSEEPKYQNEADRQAAQAISNDDQCLTCLGL